MLNFSSLNKRTNERSGESRERYMPTKPSEQIHLVLLFCSNELCNIQIGLISSATMHVLSTEAGFYNVIAAAACSTLALHFSIMLLSSLQNMLWIRNGDSQYAESCECTKQRNSSWFFFAALILDNLIGKCIIHRDETIEQMQRLC